MKVDDIQASPAFDAPIVAVSTTLKYLKSKAKKNSSHSTKNVHSFARRNEEGSDGPFLTCTMNLVLSTFDVHTV